MGLHLCQLCEIAYFVTDKIPLENVLLTDYVTTDSLLPNKEGRCIAQNRKHSIKYDCQFD